MGLKSSKAIHFSSSWNILTPLRSPLITLSNYEYSISCSLTFTSVVLRSFDSSLGSAFGFHLRTVKMGDALLNYVKMTFRSLYR
jgi:hypothetical protein